MKTTLIFLAVLAIIAGGCNSADSVKFDAALKETRTALDESRADIARLKAAATTLPASQARDQALDILDKAEKARASLSAKAAAVEAVRTAAATGDTDSIGPAVSSAISGIPVVGPYASLIGIAAGVGFGIWQRSKRKQDVELLASELNLESQHLANVVKSIEVAGPDVTEADKAAIRAVQGADTSLRVDEIKASL